MTINPAQLSAPIAGWQRGVVIAFAAAIGGLLLALLLLRDDVIKYIEEAIRSDILR